MITDFKCDDTQTLFTTGKTRRWSAIKNVAERKLLQLDNATAIEDLRAPPGNRLETLHGDREGQHSIRINAQWRLCFVWTEQGAIDVGVVGHFPQSYHLAGLGIASQLWLLILVSFNFLQYASRTSEILGITTQADNCVSSRNAVLNCIVDRHQREVNNERTVEKKNRPDLRRSCKGTSGSVPRSGGKYGKGSIS